jgi:hypothetical protein
MADSTLMDVLNTRNEFEIEFAGLFLAQTSVPDDVVEQLASVGILHDHKQLFFGLDDFIELDDVRMAYFLQDFDFTSNSLDILLIVNFVLLKNFDGDLIKPR